MSSDEELTGVTILDYACVSGKFSNVEISNADNVDPCLHPVLDYGSLSLTVLILFTLV